MIELGANPHRVLGAHEADDGGVVVRTYRPDARAVRVQPAGVEAKLKDPAGLWEAQAREQFLDGYLESVEPSLLPAGQVAIDRLLAVFELEKAVYELRYELDNRPDWVGIPVTGIQRLIEQAAAA